MYLVEKLDTGHLYAMKSQRKHKIIEGFQAKQIHLEKTILQLADHPFLVGMHYVFQTDQRVYFVMRFVEGGELYEHL